MKNTKTPNVAKALRAAIAVLYFTDNSDYKSALWAVVRALDPDAAALLEEDDSAAYKKYCDKFVEEDCQDQPRRLAVGLYRKKPVVIEAVQWFKHGDHPEVMNPVWSHCGGNFCDVCGRLLDGIHGFIKTLEGGHRVCPGDWIIKGVKGEFYPCKPDVLAATYDAVDSDN